MPRVVLDMADRRSIWGMPDWVPEELGAALPAGWELRVIEDETDGSGDGATRVSPAVLDAVGAAEVYLGFGIPEELLHAGPGLEWVHSGAAGVGKSLSATMLERAVVFTNSAGIHGPPMAETVLGMILFFFRGLDLALQGQARGEWAADPFWSHDSPLRELAGSTVGVIGFGGIGKEVARRAAGLGASVVALKRRAPAEGEGDLPSIAGGERLGAWIRLVSGAGGLNELLEESDAVVITAAETSETRGLIDASALARMRAGAVLVNVARGKIVDQDALVDALREGRVRGAGLDVFSKEPLATGDPLWKLDNVLLTPHVSGVTRGFWRRETDLVIRNLQRYLAGAPSAEWENVVDKQAGY